ncbi:hypothetical protein [Streptomyces huiliensis]|uniref:hypothetical protein n=1 Tax=Streptomyces huiliensis TaxID=2876027 RepID=UPI001CBE0402|nr:hypothetical protein [Streptomyces huiliensis]MBZ4321481.1 hypothetical protein [Streptomyces huiliensis]
MTEPSMAMPIRPDSPRDHGAGTDLRLLPWASFGNKPLYLSGSSHNSVLSRMADVVEEEQLALADDLLGSVEHAANDPDDDTERMYYLVSPLAMALRDVLRVAVSRGVRLAARAQEGGATAVPADEERWEMRAPAASSNRFRGACDDCGATQPEGVPSARRAHSWFVRHAESTGDSTFTVTVSETFTLTPVDRHPMSR